MTPCKFIRKEKSVALSEEQIQLRIEGCKGKSIHISPELNDYDEVILLERFIDHTYEDQRSHLPINRYKYSYLCICDGELTEINGNESELFFSHYKFSHFMNPSSQGDI